MKAEKAFFYKAIFQLMVPLIFAVPALLFISPYTTWFRDIISIQGAYFGGVFIMIGLAFLVEMALSMSDIIFKGKAVKNHGAGTMLFLIMAVASFIMASLVITSLYNFTDTTINDVMTLLLGVAVAILGYGVITVLPKKSSLRQELGV